MVNGKAHDVVVVGAGLAGLTTAAFLCRQGKQVLVLEAQSHLGGKCRTLQLDDCRYPVGPVMFGQRTAQTLRKLGLALPSISAPMRLSMQGGALKFPFQPLSFYSQVKSMGVTLPSFLRTGLGLARAWMAPPAVWRTNYRSLVEGAVTDPTLRKLFFAESFFLGCAPEALSAYCFKLFFGTYYGFHKPFYPIGGADRLPQTLADFITRHGGEIRTQVPVTKLMVQGDRLEGLEAAGSFLPVPGQLVLTAGLHRRLLKTEDRDQAGNAVQVNASRLGFQFATLMLRLRPGTHCPLLFGDRKESATSNVLIDTSLDDHLDAIAQGRLPENPILNLISVEAALTAPGKPLPLAVTTLWPHHPLGENEKAQYCQAVIARLDRFQPGLAEAVTWFRLITPDQYPALCGFASDPAPVLDSPHEEKSSQVTPIPRLFLAGTEVLPRGCHTGSAMQSGYDCAQLMLGRC